MIDWDAVVIGPTTKIFGGEDIFRPVGGKPFGITGVFDRGFVKEVMFEDGSTGVTTTAPTLGVQLSQFPSVPLPNDRVYVKEVESTFVVREVRPDGKGIARLMLNLAGTP